MRTTVFILILVFLPGYFLCSCKTEEKLSGGITGIITDAATSLPLPDTKVVLDRFVDSTTSSSDGKYMFSNMKAGNYDMKASKHAYAGKSSSVSVEKGKIAESNFALTSIPEPEFSKKLLDFGIDSTVMAFTITNPVQEAINYTIISSQSWITANPVSGQLKSGTNTIKVTINKSDITESIHFGEIRIISLIGNESLRDTIKVLTNGVMDDEKNYYSVIKIGTQIWMAENLSIGVLVAGGVEQAGAVKKYCYNNNASYCDIYGGLYTWGGMTQGASSDNSGNIRGICPVGWHLPSLSDWGALTSYLGETVAGKKMKEAGSSHWMTGTIGTNESGFTALPGGMWDGYSFSLGPDNQGNQQEYIWTSTSDHGAYISTQLEYNSEKVLYKQFSDKEAVAVRCVKNP